VGELAPVIARLFGHTILTVMVGLICSIFPEKVVLILNVTVSATDVLIRLNEVQTCDPQFTLLLFVDVSVDKTATFD